MNIAHINNNLGSGGVERLLTDILPGLRDKGHNVFLVVLNNRKSFDYNIHLLESNNIKIINLSCDFYNPFIIFQLIFINYYYKITIWHCHTFPSQYWLAIASFFFTKRVKIVKTEHAIHNRRMEYKYFNFINKIMYSRYDKIIAITSSISTMLLKWLALDHSKVSVIKNGVNISRVRTQSSNSPYVFDKDYFNILMVARFDGWQKDHKSIVEAMKYTDEKVRLYFVGEGQNIDVILDLVDSYKLTNKIFFLGIRSDVYYLMRSVNLNVLVSNFEGLSGVVLESLSAGVPFCGSNVSGIKECAPNNNFLFDTNSVEDISSKIMKIKKSKELQSKMIKEAGEYITKYSHEFSINKINVIYKNFKIQ
jgi:glycosyltransferase involved in cell wall biosynthesis